MAAVSCSWWAPNSPNQVLSCFSSSCWCVWSWAAYFLSYWYLLSYSSYLMRSWSWSSFIQVRVGTRPCATSCFRSARTPSRCQLTARAIQLGSMEGTAFFEGSSSASISISSILNSQILPPQRMVSATARSITNFLFLLTILPIAPEQLVIMSASVSFQSSRMCWCRSAKVCYSQMQSLRRCLPSMKLLRVQDICIWVYRGWYCYRKLLRNLNSVWIYFTLLMNFSDNLLSLSRSSTLALRLSTFRSNLTTLSLAATPSSISFLTSLDLCLCQSSSSFSRLSNEIIFVYILLTADLVMLFKCPISSVCESWWLTMSATSLSIVSLYLLNQSNRYSTSLSSLRSNSFNWATFYSYTAITASIRLVLLQVEI